MAIRPSDAQCRYEVSTAELRCYGTAIAQLTVDFPHGRRKIPVRTCPAGRVNAWRPPKGINRDPGVVRKGRQARRLRGGFGLNACIFPKTRASLLGLADTQLPGRYGRDVKRFKPFAHLPHLAGIVRRNHQTSGDFAMLTSCQGYITAIFCRSMSLPIPLRASANSANSWVSVNGIFSAVV